MPVIPQVHARCRNLDIEVVRKKKCPLLTSPLVGISEDVPLEALVPLSPTIRKRRRRRIVRLRPVLCSVLVMPCPCTITSDRKKKKRKCPLLASSLVGISDAVPLEALVPLSLTARRSVRSWPTLWKKKCPPCCFSVETIPGSQLFENANQLPHLFPLLTHAFRVPV